MSNRERRLQRASWFMRRDVQEVGADLRAARLSGGLTMEQIGRALGVSAATVMRHERGDLPGARPDDLARHAAIVGMRARIKLYPEGPRLRDAAQLELLRRFRERLPVGARLEVEVPVSREIGDQRAWDAMLTLPGCRCAIELVTRFHDCQAQLRAFQLKRRDGDADRLVVLAKATHANRRALGAAADVLASAFPLTTRRVMNAISAGRDPGADGIVLL